MGGPITEEVMVSFQTTRPKAKPPVYSTTEAAGADLFAAEPLSIPPGEARIVKTGIAIELPTGYEGQVRSRSGLAAKFAVAVLNSPGTIDSDYRGEICVILINHGPSYFEVNVGDRVAQLVVAPVVRGLFMASGGVLSQTDRGTGGLGSTGR